MITSTMPVYFTGQKILNRRTYAPLLSLLFFCLMLMGCDEKPVKPLRVGTNTWIGYETLYLARNLGFLDSAPIRLVELPSATETIHAFRNRTLEVAALTLDETLTLLESESDIKIILVIDFSHGGDVLLAQPSITTLPKLKGKRIGVENTAVGAILLDGALSEAGLTPADIEIVPLTVDEHLFAYLNGEVDGIVTFEPVKNQLLSAGAVNLFDSSQIPERIVDVLITRRQVIEDRPQDLKRLLSAYFEALGYLAEAPLDSAKRIAPRMGLSSDQILPQYAGLKIPDITENRQLLKNGNSRLKANIARLTEIMYRKELLFKPIDTRSLTDASLLPGTS
ncbi:ABC transporter substrate-binding protein [Methylomarinum vadi]|uniref:ABC transporter substrate-binding protein n=1 Tax=Methylomarinum vadi TaxID=438855 RepID=UPI00068D73E7|nr:ABC transporter substrate-binding protein [Methylomarinum vadi]